MRGNRLFVLILTLGKGYLNQINVGLEELETYPSDNFPLVTRAFCYMNIVFYASGY